MRGPETRLRKRITKALKEKYPEAVIWKIHGGAFQNVGIMDYLCCFDGLFVGMEVKTKNGKVTLAQKIAIKKVRKAGGVAGVVRSVEIALKFFELVEKRREEMRKK